MFGHKNYVARIINMFNMKTQIQLSNYRTTGRPYIANIPFTDRHYRLIFVPLLIFSTTGANRTHYFTG